MEFRVVPFFFVYTVSDQLVNGSMFTWRIWNWLAVFLTGPVFVEFPIDTLYPYRMVQKEIGASGSPGKALVEVFVVNTEW